MFQRIRDRIMATKALLLVPVVLLALGFVIYPSGGNAEEGPGTDRADQQVLTSFEECQELRDTVFPKVDDLLNEFVDSGIVDQENVNGLQGFIGDIADTGCVVQSIGQQQDALAAVADVTNMSEEEVIAGVMEHGSISEFAQANGVTEDELIDAVMDSVEANADGLVESAEVDQESVDKALAFIEWLVTKGVSMSLDGDANILGEGWDLPDHDGWKMPGR